ncbi:hypothetical protein B0H16DRAFT_1695739 [Mycena metata]|uniref:F-box domain-containing protein n=1 Tax=Mycena metata TaxID=1033252 RepID=A0AAD7MVY5_9AGAR|nr:hypothetical protein B0H16DRAFT_1695739 [Mycena metata]
MAPKPARRRRRSTLALPPEICAHICEDVTRKDLVTLCRTSRSFGNQAQRMLYHTVDLSRSTLRALVSWCLAVTRRSHLAERVHTLSLGLPGDLSSSSDVGKITRALSKCLNLKELTVHGNAFGSFGPSWESTTTATQGWIINKCPFRLTKFHNGYFKNSFLAEFWTPQTEIRVLAIPNCYDRFPAFDDQLPHLVALEVGGVAALPEDRALKRIQLHWRRYAGVDDLSTLSRFSATLTTFNLIQTLVQPHVSTLQILNKLAHELPALLHLGIIETDEYTRVEARFSEVDPLTALAKFPRLQTFVLYCQRITGFSSLINAHAGYKLDDPAELEAFGQAIMQASPPLQRAVVAARSYSGTPRHWHAGSHRREYTCILKRTADEAITSEAGTRFEFREFSMFWDD